MKHYTGEILSHRKHGEEYHSLTIVAPVTRSDVVARARELRVDPELALRSAADRFREQIDQEADRASE